jgi:hypothetical protein
MWTLVLSVSLPAGRGGSSGAKFRISLGLPVGAVINCADNTGEAFGRVLPPSPFKSTQ